MTETTCTSTLGANTCTKTGAHDWHEAGNGLGWQGWTPPVGVAPANLARVDAARTQVMSAFGGKIVHIVDAVETVRNRPALAEAVAILDPLLVDSRAKIKMHGRTFSLESVVGMPRRVVDKMPPIFLEETVAVYGLAAITAAGFEL